MGLKIDLCVSFFKIITPFFFMIPPFLYKDVYGNLTGKICVL